MLALEVLFEVALPGLAGQFDRARVQGELDLIAEIKAAAVDVVAEAAAAAGRELVFCDNEPLALEGDLGVVVDELERLAVTRFAARGRAAAGEGGELPPVHIAAAGNAEDDDLIPGVLLLLEVDHQ